MPRPKVQWPSGFVKPGDVIRLAREKYHKQIVLPTLSTTLRSVPREWVKVRPGKINRYRVREDKLLDVIVRTPGRAVVPRGYYTVLQVVQEAAKMGIKTSRHAINKKLHSWANQQRKRDKEKNFFVLVELEGIASDA